MIYDHENPMSEEELDKLGKEDFDKFMDKQKDKEIFQGIEFIPVNNIHEVLKLVFI